MNSLNRRGFLKQGLTGAAGMVAFTPSLITSASEKKEIIYRTLGKTGMKVPVISFGVMRADNPNLCKAAFEQGIYFFDTANTYQNGNNETMLGNLLKDYPRDSFYLATKVKPDGVTKEGKPTSETTTEGFINKFNESMSRLKLDYVDILYVHIVKDPELLKSKPILKALKKLKKAGRIKFAGFSTHSNEAACINAAAETDNWDVILTAYNFIKSDISELNSAIKKASEAGIGIVAMKTMAGGGFFDKEKTQPINSTAALKWALSNPYVHTTIPGMTDFDQLNLNVKILSDISLTIEEKNDLVVPANITGLYCNGCGKCIPSCPMNLPVPDLMRAYMYAHGYSEPAKAQLLLSELGTNDNPCKDCDECKVECIKNFNIKDKITDISRLVNVPVDFLT
jgi:uncharacterized protein